MITESLWEFKIVNNNGDVILNLKDATNRRVSIGLNSSGTASFSYNLEELHDAATKIGQTIRSVLGIGINTLMCYRDGVLRFSGMIMSADYSIDQINGSVDVTALGWLWLFSQRYIGLSTDVVYSAEDVGEIIWDCVDTVQSELYGDIGITRGTIQTSLNRSITITRKSVKDIMDEFSGIVDFEISPSKVLNIYYPQKGSDKSNSVKFLYPGNEFISIEEVDDATEIYNYIYALGYGLGSEELTAIDEDINSQSVFKKRQNLLSAKDVQNAVVLADMASQEVDEKKNLNPVYKLKIVGNSSQVESIAVGDYIGVKITKDYYSVSRSLRVFEIHFSVDEKDLETIEFVLGLI
jgi:hypothetical protein